MNPTATRALGAARLEQVNTLTSIAPNLVEGRELNNPQAVALDLTTKPPHLYVSDTGNNRVLGWKDATTYANGATADLVIGQNDLLSTLPQGPGRSGRTSSGLASPMGMVVDGTGNLYVIDAGNNRILRFPAPFTQPQQFPDLVLGQQSFNTGTANAGGISASTLSLSTSSGVSQTFLKLDNVGNLWVADTNNQRVLRYPASSLTTGNNGPAADLVLGQSDFNTGTLSANTDSAALGVLRYPTGIAFDQIGRLFVSESQPSQTVRSRILVFLPPFTTNKQASRIIGVVASTNPVQPPPVSDSQMANAAAATFSVNNNIGIADTQFNRILIFPGFEQFTSDTLTQKAVVVIGQADFNSAKPNRGNADANNNTLQLPSDAAFSGTELFVADAGNNRVLALPLVQNSSTLGFSGASRVLGQDFFSGQAPNLLEGREFRFVDTSSTSAADAGIAVDLNSNPPHLYVADPYNNRILGFTDLRTVQTGAKADLVIGQADFTRSVINWPSGSPNTPNASGLFHPTGITVDAAGNLYVADTGNGRVLRFPAPFAQPSKLLQPADLVLGQGNFTTKLTDPTNNRMAQPYGIAFAGSTGLLVSDIQHNRVLLFPGTSFTNGMAATKVWGQPSFNSIASGAADNRFNAPHHIALDSSQRLFVADSGNNRIVVFDDIRQVPPGSDPHSVLTSPSGAVNSPRSIFIDPNDNVWIGDNGRAIRFSGGFGSLFTSNWTPDLQLTEAGAIALAVDSNNALYVADIANRVAIHYVGLAPLNAANYLTSRSYIAPNTIVSLFSQGGNFGAGTGSFLDNPNPLPLPTRIFAVEVRLNGRPLPLFLVSPTQINFFVPNDAPTSGTADLQVIRTDNGQVLGDTTVGLNTVAPGLFTMNAQGTGQVAAINEDGTYNGASNPIGRGHVLQVFGTGLGAIAGAPNDGSAVSGATPTTLTTVASIGGISCPVQYSGLAPGNVGLWQINVLVADGVVPTTSQPNKTSVLVIQLAGTPAGGPALGRETDVWVKQ